MGNGVFGLDVAAGLESALATSALFASVRLDRDVLVSNGTNL